MYWQGSDGSRTWHSLLTEILVTGMKFQWIKIWALVSGSKKLADVRDLCIDQPMVDGCDHQPVQQRNLSKHSCNLNELFPDDAIHSSFDEYCEALESAFEYQRSQVS